MKHAWTIRQLAILETTARVSSVFSLLGAGWIILTFSVSPAFHKPINRLAFFAAFGNVITNVATLISRDGIKLYEEGGGHALCKVQGTIIQWFMPADVLFCAAMALNVYLTVFKKYSASQLQRLEIRYILACYGIPFIPAITYAFISKTEGGKKYPLYESATLWCWVSDKWQILRIATFYGPVWVMLSFTFAVYILAGRVIFELRDSLRGFAKESSKVRSFTTSSISGNGDAGIGQQSRYGPSQGYSGYSCTVESAGRPTSGISVQIMAQRSKIAMEANTAAWAYCRCAMLFFLALVITWIPSSINRIYTIIYPGATNFGLNFASALVLPCQGLWNGIIYTVTTLPACKELLRVLRDKIRNVFGKEPIGRRKRHTRNRADSELDVKEDVDRGLGGGGREGRIRGNNLGEYSGSRSIGSSMDSMA